MKLLIKTSVLIIVLFVIQQNVNAQINNSIKQFEFMLGNWIMNTPEGKITETWRKSKDGMIGKSYRYETKGRRVLTERVELKLTADVFNFSVTGFEEGNKGTTNFKLVSSKGNTFVFENKKNDFPKRIVYQRKQKNNLLAWIEGSINGKMKRIDFPYERKK